MPNRSYTNSANPAFRSSGSSALIRTEFTNIAAGFAEIEGEIDVEAAARIASDALKAPLASPALTGTPTAPTADLGTNTTQIATMAALQQAVFDSANLPAQPGNAGKFITTDGTNASWGSALSNMVVFTSSGSWVATTDKIRVTVVGGGASSSTSGNTNSGGSAGGTAIKTLTVTKGATYTINVGAGGIAVTTATTSGNNGGTSEFIGSDITTVSATGGTGGSTGAPPGLPGIGSNGDINLRGGYGFKGVSNTGISGNGGASYLSGSATQDVDGLLYGGGAGATYGMTTGKAGADGTVIIEY